MDDHPSTGRRHLDGRRADLPLAPVVGTGKYKDLEQTAAAIEASRGGNRHGRGAPGQPPDPKAPMLQDYVDPKQYTYLPNTAGCHTARGRRPHPAPGARGRRLEPGEAGSPRPPPTLYPDMPATFEAAEALLRTALR